MTFRDQGRIKCESDPEEVFFLELLFRAFEFSMLILIRRFSRMQQSPCPQLIKQDTCQVKDEATPSRV